jgi:hypothetical protein
MTLEAIVVQVGEGKTLSLRGSEVAYQNSRKFLGLGWTGEHEGALNLAYNTINSLEGDPYSQVIWLNAVPIVHMMAGQPEDGLSAVHHAVAAAASIGNPTLLAYATSSLVIPVAQTDLPLAVALAEQAASMAGSVRNTWIATSMEGALILISRGLGAKAEETLSRAIDLGRT